MRKNLLIYAVCLSLCLVGLSLAQAKPEEDILGLRIGMSRADATARLEQIGAKDHDERKQQEVWTLNNDARFSHIIIAYDKEYTGVRFVTAKARAGGKRVRYSEVVDIKQAALRAAANNYTYTLEMPPRGKQPGYKIIARGTDKDYLTYLALEELDGIRK